jgi:hypothetical protein
MRQSNLMTILVAAIVMALFAPCAVAQQQDAKSLLGELSNRQTALANIGSIERVAARIVYVETTALISELAEWPEEELDNWPKDAEASKKVYDVKNLYARMTQELASLRRTASRKGIYTESEAERLASLLDELQVMVEDSQALYALLKAKDLEEADLFFRDVIRARYEGIVADSFTLGKGITQDISRIAIEARRLE